MSLCLFPKYKAQSFKKNGYRFLDELVGNCEDSIAPNIMVEEGGKGCAPNNVVEKD